LYRGTSIINKKDGKLKKELKELEKEKNKSDEQIVRIRELCISYEKVLKKLKK
jgi:DNA primase